jgi:putative glutamine amidotransferase
MIKIGITSCFFYPDVSRTVFGPKSLSYVENDMFRFVSQKGILPVLIPDLHQDLLKEILDELDGFVFHRILHIPLKFIVRGQRDC